MSEEIIGYRYIRHRATGKPAGPLAPIFRKDWPYNLPPSDQIIWRYLDLWKFESMLRTSSLYFCRCDKFRDPLEGRLSKPGIQGTSASDKAFTTVYPIKEDYAARAAAQEVTRGCMFVNCWYMDERESDRMWKEYTCGAESVVVVSSVRVLQEAIPEQEVVLSAVRYVPEDFPKTEFDHSSIFFYKDLSFQHERELRLLRPLRETEEVYVDRKEDFGRLVRVNLDLLVQRVILNPGIADGGRQKVIDLVQQFCPSALVQESSLRTTRG